MKSIKFYSVYDRKSVMIPENKTSSYKSKNGKPMLTAKDSKGRKLYKFV